MTVAYICCECNLLFNFAYGIKANRGTFLCDVNSETEAFAEMRRFNEINGIFSDETYVCNIKEHRITDYDEEKEIIIPEHKRIGMTTCFAIYYKNSPARKFNKEKFDESSPTEKTIKKQIETYLKDLAERRAGGE